MKRLAPWQQEKARTAKALRELPSCATLGCTGKAMGVMWVTLRNGKEQPVLACVKCASEAQRARRERT